MKKAKFVIIRLTGTLIERVRQLTLNFFEKIACYCALEPLGTSSSEVASTIKFNNL